MWLVGVFGINQDLFYIYYNKDIKFFRKDLVGITLKTGIGKTQEHDLVFEAAISGMKCRFPFVIFSNPDLVIGTGEI